MNKSTACGFVFSLLALYSMEQGGNHGDIIQIFIPLLFEEGLGEEFSVHNKTSRKRALRHNATPAEIAFWSNVHAKKFLGLKFRRQHDIGNYIVDFCCPELRLIIEIDGDSHFTPLGLSSDKNRTEYLQGQGFVVVRYTNLDIMSNIEGVFEDLKNKISILKPSPNLSLKGRGKDRNHVV